MKKQYHDIYLLPSSFTVANIFFGFLSLIFCFHQKYAWAAFWIIISAAMDAFDGIIARSTGTQSDFGTELDSLADAFSFGAAPSVLLYFWGLKIAGTPGVFFSFIFLTGGILRLARYNIRQKTQPDRKYYTGLTIPSASLLIASLVLYHPQPLETKSTSFILALVTLFISFCMVSTIKYRNFLNFNFRQRIELKTVLLIAVIIGCLIFYTTIFLLLVFSLNALFGPVSHAYSFLKKRIHAGAGREEISP